MKKNYRKKVLYWSILFIALSFNGCNSDDPIEEPEEDPIITMTLSQSNLDFGYFRETLSFYVKNEGNTNFNWNWDNNGGQNLSASPNSGLLNAGDSVSVNISLDREDLLTNNYQLNTFVRNDFNQSALINVEFDHFVETKWLIEGTVIDAEYDRNKDVIIVVSENPNELRVFKPSDGSVATISLNLAPSCVSVSISGDFAVVGHNGWISHVNLSTMQLVDNYTVSANVYDIVLAPNNWAYVFPKQDQWENIRCVDLSNGNVTFHTGNSIYEQTKAKLHPSGNFIYGATRGLSPSDFEKYGLANGIAEYLYDSPYHGDYSFNGDIWISDDGSRLFAKSRNVFKSSSMQSIDMTYNGQLDGNGLVVALDYSSQAERVYAIFSVDDNGNLKPSSEIRKYETEFLGFRGIEELPRFIVPDGNGDGTLYNSLGYFGFFNANGTKYYTLVKIEDGTGAQNEWAIVTTDVD